MTRLIIPLIVALVVGGPAWAGNGDTVLLHFHSPMGHYDEPETFSYAIPLICSIGTDVRQSIQVAISLSSSDNVLGRSSKLA